MFRLDRPSFEELLEKIDHHFERDSRGARSIPVKIQLAVALRFVAGGSYLDIAFAFNFNHTTFMTSVWKVLEIIDAELDNINFPLDDYAKLQELEAGFSRISMGKFPGTVAAGDGVVFRMQRPTKVSVDGVVTSFYTRKGFYGYAMQAFVDSRARFLNISMKMASSTHDATAYVLSDLSKAIRNGRLHPDFHIVLDEAYPNKKQELSPFRGKELDIWRDSFNYHLSLHRQCVERAFGILVQRFYVFWRPIRVAFERIPLLIRVCCRLHNYCIDKFGADRQAVAVARGDARPGDDATALFTDETGHSRGRRVDLEASEDTRLKLMKHLEENNHLRPEHSTFTKVRRI